MRIEWNPVIYEVGVECRLQGSGIKNVWLIMMYEFRIRKECDLV